MSTSRGQRSHAVVALALVTLCACDHPTLPAPPPRPAPPTTLRDWVSDPPDAARQPAAPRQRLLSTAPNVTEMCAALGLADQLVGRTRYCVYPPAVSGVPSVGDLYNLSPEVLLALQPDLILISGRSRSIRDRLERLDLRFQSIPDVALADLWTGLQQLAAQTGRTKAAAALRAGIEADLAQVARHFASTPPQRVLVVLAPLADPPTPPHVAGPGSFYHDLLTRAGHRNVADTAGRAFAPLSLEFILHADPDVIIELVAEAGQRPAGDADARRVWAQLGPLTAVRQGRVHVLRGHQHMILGPRVAHTFEALCRIIAGQHDASD